MAVKKNKTGTYVESEDVINSKGTADYSAVKYNNYNPSTYTESEDVKNAKNAADLWGNKQVV